jgi:sugar/nucleoside kinase (ribokinase family)
MTRLVCVGHSTIDTIYQVAAIPSTPTKVLANAYAEAGGGMAANASVAAARLGGIVHYWGRVGDDAIGEHIVALLEDEGVQTAAVRRIEGARSPCTAALVDDRGERLICTYNDPALDADAAWLPIAGGMVGVTLGADGFLWLDAGHEQRARPPRVVAVDTFAAGDVFHGAPVRAEVETLLRSA